MNISESDFLKNVISHLAPPSFERVKELSRRYNDFVKEIKKGLSKGIEERMQGEGQGFHSYELNLYNKRTGKNDNKIGFSGIPEYLDVKREFIRDDVLECMMVIHLIDTISKGAWNEINNKDSYDRVVEKRPNYRNDKILPVYSRLVHEYLTKIVDESTHFNKTERKKLGEFRDYLVGIGLIENG